MSKENQNPETEEKAPAAEARLCKGTMPSCLVWYIKFHEAKDNKSEIAKKYCTTPGKISDIQGNANQKYIVEDMVFSDAELDAAREQIKTNFTRGQAEEAAKPGSVNKRSLASTQPGDEEYSLAAIDAVQEFMEAGAEGKTLEEARAEYNAENPRAPRAPKAESTDDDGDDVTDEPTDDGDDSDEDLDGLLD